VKWILPTEYAGDGLNEALVDAVPVFHSKRAARKQVEELAERYEGLKWIGVATNPWMEFVSSMPFLLFLFLECLVPIRSRGCVSTDLRQG
jgi:hypothetical protein